MKKAIVTFSIIMLSSMMLLAQSGKGQVEVLYFKANLACCKAKACNSLEAEIQNIILKNFTDSSVVFKEVKLADEANKSLVEKHKAQSQTVVLVKKTRKKEISMDITDIIKTYLQNGNKAELEKALLAKIQELQKKKK